MPAPRIPSLFCVQLALSALLLGCSSTRDISSSYQAVIEAPTSGATTFVLLIDGLPVATLKSLFESKKLPHLKKYFLGEKSEFYQARSVFPSLTYPNLVSLITEKPVSHHRIYGNKVFLGGQFFDFESPATHRFLNKHIADQNIFSRLRERGLKSVAIGYNFWSDTTSHTHPADLEAAVHIMEKRYLDVDSKLVASLQVLLDDTPPNKWPDFIFMHLIGLDFISHDHGPDSPEAHLYLRKLDEMLGEVLQKLETAESQGRRKVVALLTSDHGFSLPVKKTVDLKSRLPSRSQVVIQNEGRMASLILPESWSREEKQSYYNQISLGEGLLLKAMRLGTDVYIDPANVPPSGSLDLRENLIRYFQNPDHPGMILMAAPGYGFTSAYQGFHGGTTQEEMTIPLLLRNGRLRDPTRLPYIHELLGFVSER